MGKDFGTCGIVVLQLEMDETGQNLEMPCYVLDSNKPFWQGELKNGAVLLGTNAHTQVTFHKSVHLKPRSTKCIQVTVDTEGIIS